MADAATEIALIRIVDALDRAVDGKDFAAARALFADRIWFAAEALTGAPGSEIAADELVGGWARNLNRHKASFHMRSNHQAEIAGGGAVVRSAGYAWNRLDSRGDALWEVCGDYVHRFVRIDGAWKINGFELIVRHQRGDFAVRDTLPPQD